MSIKYFIGPMSKNVVDTCIEFCNDTGEKIGFIPSRRQVEYDGGYVNNWTTQAFSEYVTESGVFLVRDHGGPGQGLLDDDGYISLENDCKHMDMIHIDPWKKYSDFQTGLEWTVKMIQFCYDINPSVYYEVATEQSIREFQPDEIDILLSQLKLRLTPQQYEQIKYCVIQSGTSLKENTNTGDYDKSRLQAMIQVVKKHGLLSKEHNGDYLPPELIKQKMNLGLDSINIAPEFGQIEIKTYLHKIKTLRPDLLETLWQICYDSKRWEKWVDSSFRPLEQKEELINICGHYVLSNQEFLSKIRSQFSDIDSDIKTNIKNKLDVLHNG